MTDPVRTSFRLHSVAIRLLREVRKEDARTGMSPARLSVLSILVFGGPRTLGALAAAEQVAPPTMTRLVAALERDGFLERHPDPHDGRVVVARATPRARRLLRAGRSRRLHRLQAITAGFGPSDWAALERAVTLLEAALPR